jgi:chitinase
MSRRRVRQPLAVSVLSVAVIAGLAALVIGGPAAYSDVAANEQCRPDGLYRTPGVDVPYCLAYDTAGREKMGSDHPRRIIGYFTSWRHGKDGTPPYLAATSRGPR